MTETDDKSTAYENRVPPESRLSPGGVIALLDNGQEAPPVRPPADIVERLRARMQQEAIGCKEPPILGYTGDGRLLDEAADEIERLRDAMWEIDKWSRAYPQQVFPTPDLERARELLMVGGITLDAVSAYAMRHVVEQVAKVARDALTASRRP